MAKAQEAAFGTAVLIAAVLFGTRGFFSVAPSKSSAPGASTAASSEAVQGPWIASCNYWAPVHTASSPDTSKPSAPASETDVPPEHSGCSASDWGLPDTGSGHVPDIRFAVATVADPIHSHLSLGFDRTIDALLVAGADNGYLGSYYWLPWRSHISPQSKEASEPTSTEDLVREHQPGLIILRRSPQNGSPQNLDSVIYVFLVAETPGLGINGTQMQNALRYQYRLQTLLEPLNPARKDARPEPLRVIGPAFSGSAASLSAALTTARRQKILTQNVLIAGMTSTAVASQELGISPQQSYISFGENTGWEIDRFLDELISSGYQPNRVALLSEENTVFGKKGAVHQRKARQSRSESVLQFSFPREISLLRNAETNTSGQSSNGSSVPTPYLNLSLKDLDAADDTVPRFSTSQSPISLEAQLITLAHQLQRDRVQFIAISASNILDELFLAQFLHRACPDARLTLFNGEDDLFAHDTENASYIGSITVSPYLVAAPGFRRDSLRAYPDFEFSAVYNAASFLFWDLTQNTNPHLAGYQIYSGRSDGGTNSENKQHPSSPTGAPSSGPAGAHHDFFQIPLWALVIGSDGYYPLAVLDWCASDDPSILPTIYPEFHSNPAQPRDSYPCDSPTIERDSKEQPGSQRPLFTSLNNNRELVPSFTITGAGIAPALSWTILVGFFLLLCAAHCCAILFANYWSPLTRDLAINRNDEPRRRAVYLNIGTTCLFVSGLVLALPLLRVHHYFAVSPAALTLAYSTIFVGLLALACTFVRVRPYVLWRKPRILEYSFFNLLALLAVFGLVIGWWLICANDRTGPNNTWTYAGLFFSYRCLNPLNGVCPLTPVLLVLGAWYLWAICQTARLRFSPANRPRLPGRIDSAPRYASFYVRDEALEKCEGPMGFCLYRNITTLLISRELLSRRIGHYLAALVSKLRSGNGQQVSRVLDVLLLVIYLTAFIIFLFTGSIQSLDHFISGHHTSRLFFPTRYEGFIATIFFPLVMIALSGWLRAMLIWGALRRGLLEPLERMPLRFAFTRLKAGGWFTIFRQSGLHMRWRDMARTSESIRQLLNLPRLRNTRSLQDIRKTLEERTAELLDRIGSPGESQHALDPALCSLPEAHQDHPFGRDADELALLYCIETSYADFCRELLAEVLIPYWNTKRTGFVDATKSGTAEDSGKDEAPGEPEFILAAEELLVVRYVGLIRAVLVNLNYLMSFVTACFVLALVAWNSYPFQPHAFIDWCFTMLLFIIGIGFLTIFAQMHRNPILSRITDTRPNELGWQFFLRIGTFGAVPVLTWLAYQFPSIGGYIYRLVQPGLQIK